MNEEELIEGLLDRLTDQAVQRGRAQAETDYSQAEAFRLRSELAQYRLQQPAVTMPQIEALLTAMRRDMKINTIREVRALTGASLKDSKDMVDRVFDLSTSSA